ncbi:hypothetical protein DFH11DRAFT_1776248 [Phellopilus nigrolimitatus]|nr:hypothetical protein DFH11DRAFT_1776248 [Phellopilus nigrolimitatus]
MRYSNCSRCVPKNKAIKRFTVRDMVEPAIIRDIFALCPSMAPATGSCAARTARAVFPRIRPSGASLCSTWSSPPLSVTSQRCRSIRLYLKVAFRVSCTIHSNVVRVHLREGRRIRTLPLAGRLLASTKRWRRLHVKVNQSQRRLSVVSAFTSTELPALVLARDLRKRVSLALPLPHRGGAAVFR